MAEKSTGGSAGKPGRAAKAATKPNSKPAGKPKPAAKKNTKPKPRPKPSAKPRPKAERGPRQKPGSSPGRVVTLLRSLAEPAGAKAKAAGSRLHWDSPGGRAALVMLRALALLLLFLSVLEILRVTLVPTPGSVGFVRPNMHPFATIRLYLHDGTIEEQVFQIGGNVALGFILGFLMPQITPYLRGLIRVELVTVLFVSAIELVQHYLIPGTTLTIDDVILTAVGAALGYFPLGRMFGMRLHPYHLHWWQRVLSRWLARRRA